MSCSFDSFIELGNHAFTSGLYAGPFNLYNKLFIFATPTGTGVGTENYPGRDVAPYMYVSRDYGDSWETLSLNLSGINLTNYYYQVGHSNKNAYVFIYDTGNPDTLKLKLGFALDDSPNNRTAFVFLTFDPQTETVVPPGASGFLPGFFPSVRTTEDLKSYFLATNRSDGTIVMQKYGDYKAVKGTDYIRPTFGTVSTQGVYTDLGLVDDSWGAYHCPGDYIVAGPSGIVHCFLRRYLQVSTPYNTWVYYSPIHISLNSNNTWNASTTFPTGIRFIGRPTLFNTNDNRTGMFLIGNHFASGSKLLIEVPECKTVPTFQYTSLPTNCDISSPKIFVRNASVGDRRYIFGKRHAYGGNTGVLSTGEYFVLYANNTPGSTWDFLKYNIGRSGGQYWGRQNFTGTKVISSCVYMTGCNANSLGIYVSYGQTTQWKGSGAFIKTTIPPYYLDTNQHIPIENKEAFSGYTIVGTGHLPIEYQATPTYPITGIRKTPTEFLSNYQLFFNNEIELKNDFIDTKNFPIDNILSIYESISKTLIENNESLTHDHYKLLTDFDVRKDPIFTFEIENKSDYLTVKKSPLEELLMINKTDYLSVEEIVRLININTLPVDKLGFQIIEALKNLPIETINALISITKNPLEFISTYYGVNTISTEGLVNAISTQKIVIEKLGQLLNIVQLPTEQLIEVAKRCGFSLENLDRINITDKTLINVLRNVSKDRRIPIDILGAALVTAIGHLPIDYIGDLLFDKNFEIESSLTIERFSKLFTEDLRQTNTLKTLPVGYLNNITLSNELPVSQLLKLSKDRSTPIDILLYLPSIDSICKVEANIRSSIIRELYVDIAGGALLRFNSVVPLDFKTGFDIKRSASIEQLLSLVASSVSAVGFSEGVLLADSVPISWSYDLSLTNKILTELAGINTIIIGNHINVDFLSNIYLDRNTLIEALEAIQPLGYGTFIETLNGVNRNTRVPLSFLGISSAIKALKWVLNSRSSSWTLDEQDNIWTF